MRVGLLIYGDPDSVSGGYLYNRKLVDYLRRQGDSVDIISLPYRPWWCELLYPPDLLSRVPAQLDILVQDELVHPSVLRHNRRLRERTGIPIVALVHLFAATTKQPAWKEALFRLSEHRYLRSVDALIVNSRHTLGQATRLLTPGRLPPHLVAVPAGDNFGQLTATPHGQPVHSDDSGRLRILSVGNLIRQKGLHVLLQALHRLPNRDFHLSICGRTDMEPYYVRTIRAQIHQYGLQDRVSLYGPLERSALARLYASHDIFVLPSVNEAYGIVYIEAQQFGLPAIGTSAGGAGEIIHDGIDGYLIPPDDSDRLSLLLAGLQQNRGLLKSLGEQARLAYDRHPAWDDSCSRIRAFLLDLIHHHGATRAT